jgi:hypothetical protein
MNNYFLGMLTEDKKRQRNRAKIINLREFRVHSKKDLEFGDAIVFDNLFYYFVLGSSKFITKKFPRFSVPYPLMVTDRDFTPYYWIEFGITHIHFSDKIILRLIDSINNRKYDTGIVKVKIKKTRYNFLYQDNTISHLGQYLNKPKPIFDYVDSGTSHLITIL